MLDFSRLRLIGIALALPFLVGVASFLLAGLLEGMGGSVFSALVEQSTAERHNPLLASVPGLLPVLLVLLVVAIAPRWAPSWAWGRSVVWGGLIPVALLEAWAHLQFWTLFLPDRNYPGFPHGLELVIVPLFFAPIGALVGMAVALGFAGRSPEEGGAE